ncbi:hypothetical protein Hanom_Chr16g01488241 [Helianthus anomalus]
MIFFGQKWLFYAKRPKSKIIPNKVTMFRRNAEFLTRRKPFGEIFFTAPTYHKHRILRVVT